MEALNFRNNYTQNQPEEVKKRLETQENFTALDKDKIKRDTVEITSKATEGVKDTVRENWFYKQLRHIGVEDPKKLVKSVIFAIITTIGLMAIGNKLSNPTADLGQKLGDEIIAKSKPYQWLQKGAGAIKNWLLKIIDSNKYTKEIHKTFTTNMEHAKLDIARGYGQGFLGIFSLTPVEVLQKSLEKMGVNADKIDDAVKILNEKLKIDEETARELSKQIFGTAKDKWTRKEICTTLTNSIAEGFGCKNKKELLKLFKDMQTNPEFSDFFNIKMSDKGLSAIANSWWPANFVNKITGGKFQRHLTGNLGDSLVKFNVVNGTMAESKAGTFIQRLVTIPTESISNFVNDKSGVGLFISGGCMIPLYNNVQDAPKKQKLPTILNDYVGGMGTFAFSLPAANAITYGLASMANFNTDGKILLKPLKAIGKFFKTGLADSPVTKTGFAGFLQKLAGNFKGTFGGALRFVMIMLVVSPFVSKVIHKVVSKIFGKPYDPAEIAKEKKAEEEKNKVIPELGITQGELQDKIAKNPAAIQKLQNNPELVKAIDKNPKLMLDLLDNKEINLNNVNNAAQNTLHSPMLQSMIDGKKSNDINSADLFASKSKNKNSNIQEQTKDQATYIPSSEFVANPNALSDSVTKEYNEIMAQADKALSNAEKYI